MRPDVAGVAGTRALVTGATGYIGPALCRRLSEAGADVCAVSRSAREGGRAGVRWRACDLADPVAARDLVQGCRPDLVFHLAGLAAGSRDLELVLPTLRSNLLSTVGLLSAVAVVGTGRVVLAASMEEPDAAETAVAVPSSPYAASKWAAGAYGRMFHALYRTPVTIARTFMVYGPGEQDERKLLPYVIRSFLDGAAPRLGDGRRRIDWVYMDDVVDGLIRLALAPGVEGATVDIGAGRAVSIREVVERVGGLAGAEAAPEFGARAARPMEQVRVADAEATFRRIGWRAGVTLEEGLGRTVEWYRGRRADAAAARREHVPATPNTSPAGAG